jgi:hypothetical protein
MWKTAALLLATLRLAAQISTGTINLQVKDSTGAVIPGAAVSLKHTATGLMREGATNDRGE